MKGRRLTAGKIVAKLRDYAFDRTEVWKKSFPAGLDVPKLESFDPIDVSFEANKTGRFSGHASIIVSKTVRMAGQDQIGSASYNARVTGHIDGQSVIADDLTLTSDR
jgi:hypothetical protein